MRKLWILVLLVPFVALWTYGCDEHPTQPETAVAATTAQEGPAPQAARVSSPQAKTVRLSGAEVVGYAAGDSNVGFKSTTVECPAGKFPISGGYRILGSGNDYTVLSNGPNPFGGADSGIWRVEAKRTAGSDSWNLIAYAVCVDAEAASP